MNNTLIVIVKFLHDLFTAIWIGGLFLITLSLFPALKKTFGHSAESEKVMDNLRWDGLSVDPDGDDCHGVYQSFQFKPGVFYQHEDTDHFDAAAC